MDESSLHLKVSHPFLSSMSCKFVGLAGYGVELDRVVDHPQVSTIGTESQSVRLSIFQPLGFPRNALSVRSILGGRSDKTRPHDPAERIICPIDPRGPPGSTASVERKFCQPCSVLFIEQGH